jgi:hypothetical protein
LSKKKSKKKTSLSKRIRTNAKTIGIVAVVVAIFSGISFYLGMATPRSYTVPIALSTSMGLEVDQWITVSYGPAHTGIRVSFEVASNSDSWTLSIYKMDGTPLDSLSSTLGGMFETENWLYSPEGCRIYIRSSRIFPGSMNLDGTLTITSSRFPFI